MVQDINHGTLGQYAGVSCSESWHFPLQPGGMSENRRRIASESVTGATSSVAQFRRVEEGRIAARIFNTVCPRLRASTIRPLRGPWMCVLGYAPPARPETVSIGPVLPPPPGNEAAAFRSSTPIASGSASAASQPVQPPPASSPKRPTLASSPGVAVPGAGPSRQAAVLRKRNRSQAV